jgi:PAS domain S-box-containing protein
MKEAIKQSVEILRLESNEWEVIFNSIQDPVSIHDKDFKITKANTAFAELFGLEPEKLVGKKCYELIHKTEEPWLNCPHKQALGCGKQGSAEFLEPRLGKYLQVSVSPICNEKSEMIGCVHIIKDITERRKAEAALKGKDEKYRKIFNNVQDIFYQTDIRGIIVEISPSIKRYAGFTREELIGKSVEDLYYSLEDRMKFLRVIQEKGEVADFEIRLRTKDNRLIYTSANSHLLFDSTGNPTGVEGTLRDITERKQAEEALTKTMDALGERVKELNCLYGIASLVERPDITLEEIIQGILDLMPAAWQYPKITCARITYNEREYKTGIYRKTQWRQSSNLMVNDRLTGVVEVYYLEERPASDEGPFLKEERLLINAIAERLGKIIERMQIAQEKEQLLIELKEALSKVKTLSGFLPICASCKKIRDDKGYWNQIETYISKHSDVDFSHSICPDCAKKLYPELHKS